MTRPLIVTLLLVAASTAGAGEKNLERTFTVSANGSLIVDADAASVHVSGTDTNQVVVHMTARASDDDLATAKLEAYQKGDEVTVTMRTQGKMGWFGRSWHGDSRIEVTVPRHIAIDVRTGGGEIELADTTGAAKLHTSGGDIVAKNLGGTLEARTSGGGIRVDTVRGDVDAGTSGGDVHLLHVDGKIRGDTSGGNVECSLVGANRGITATTSGGNIRLILPRNTAGMLEAKTSGGGIKTDIPVTTTEMQEGHMRGSLNGGGPLIEARTSGGDISLHAE
ncbi:MAG TPA: DUF4097 family beta strand repeat-containing protein [Steroidobacteraceae bacterium]|nr:DUF4097 family beta strand repeat-containing protein [Steroidobacteraceae bacterium]